MAYPLGLRRGLADPNANDRIGRNAQGEGPLIGLPTRLACAGRHPSSRDALVNLLVLSWTVSIARRLVDIC
jgi:hypothetical protein